MIDDRWQKEYGRAESHPTHWPDLRGWIAEKHKKGIRVLLWWKAWDPTGLPAEECVRDPSGRPVAVDPGNPAYLARLQEIAAQLVSPDGLNADGLKVDFSQRAPAGPALHQHLGERRTWGIAALHQMLQALYAGMKASKPDSLLITHTAHPSFGDVCDMVRLNDLSEQDPYGTPVPVVEQLRFRAAVARTALPHHLIDTDQWPMPDRKSWLSPSPTGGPGIGRRLKGSRECTGPLGTVGQPVLQETLVRGPQTSGLTVLGKAWLGGRRSRRAAPGQSAGISRAGLAQTGGGGLGAMP